MNKRDTTYYYKKRSPLKGIIFTIIIIAVGAGAFWYYTNFFTSSLKPIELEEDIQSGSGSLLNDIRVIYADEGALNYTGEERNALEAGSVISLGDVSTASGRLAIQLNGKGEARLNDNTRVNPTADPVFFEGRAIFKGRANNILTSMIALANANFPTAEISGGEYELRTVDLNSFEVVALDEQVVVKVNDREGEVSSTRLDLYERLVINPSAGKHSLVRVYDFDQSLLESDEWYVWNSNFVPQITEIDETEGEMTVTESDQVLELSASEKENGIFLTWAMYDQANFKRYEIVRSSTSVNPVFGRAENIKTSTTRSLNSFMDYDTDSDSSYYYRICVITLEGEVVCGSSAGVERVSEEEETITLAPPTLSASVSPGGVNLSWTAQTGNDLLSYSVLRSQTKAVPQLSEEVGSLATTTFTDLAVGAGSPGRYYYRVCTKTATVTSCSNVVEVIDGAIQ